ncbi:hypothetical protein JD844_018142 [Phrynosoma platyrhinos]|uniref:Putative hydroxypyruvate isomerase n=1 Tax=Phrynosoma platyrhinos TaxID=52577 RepID=A0ABQ7SN19_PHRPL|nr:hypothetical protein JD844_018142 [Phrynosoma platyrhinos]
MEAAGRAGFRAAEVAFPYGQGAPRELRAAAERAALELVLINTPPVTTPNGHEQLPYACRIHIMAGRIPKGAEREAVSAEMEATFIENLRYATDILAQVSVAILKKVGNPNLKLQLDIFHCQIMDGNLTQNLETYFPVIGHIQIAQVPGRHEPDSPGELNYPYLFQLLESMDYSGYIGCEYKPKGKFFLRSSKMGGRVFQCEAAGDTLKGLGWARSYWESHGLLHGGS